jgi:hypothetical protein
VFCIEATLFGEEAVLFGVEVAVFCVEVTAAVGPSAVVDVQSSPSSSISPELHPGGMSAVV